MKSVGERIRQAREYRGLSGEDLAHKVGYKTQSGISNLENRSTGNGGNKLPLIAEALGFSLEWFLQGPDCADMSQVTAYRPPRQLLNTPIEPTNHQVSEQLPPQYVSNRAKAHMLIDLVSENGIEHCLAILQSIASRFPAQHIDSAGLPIPAHDKRAA